MKTTLMLRKAVAVLGFAVAAFGILFMLQGGGAVHWPQSSSMLDQSVWIGRGFGVALVGVALIFVSRRIR